MKGMKLIWMKRSMVLGCVLALGCAVGARADDDGARFDLTGPKIDVRVTRGSESLPIAEVPNLQAGDKIWVKADLPASQSNHLLLIVAFLRGTTNEPPDNWFTEIDTWDKKQVEGTVITVPAEAEQALLFVAPETGGDFKTLRSAVKGKPGLFIRADADLNEASFEQQRIERYLAGMKTVANDDEKTIEDRSKKLASTLALKPDDKCLKLPVDQQVTCLTQSSAPLLLSDGHGQGVAEALSTGASSDFINAASTTQVAGAGVYSAYVGTIVDLVHLVTLLKTAQYQYIPAISFPQAQTLNLKLNAPPSFHNPKTVIVIGLPEIQKAKTPPLKVQDANEVACLLQPKMTLHVQGAPLVFSTAYAHDIVLHLNRNPGEDIPLTADAFEGGLVVSKGDARKPLQDVDAKQAADKNAGKPGDLTVTGTVRGRWGFDSFEGPTLTVQQVDAKGWKIVGDTQLLAGKDNKLTLQGDAVGCVQHVALTDGRDKDVDVAFKPDGEKDKAKTTLDLNASLKEVKPGGYSLVIQQYGEAEKAKVPLTAYTGDVHFDALTMHAGDNVAVLTGQGVDNVASVDVAGQVFTPGGEGNDAKTVHLQAKGGASPKDGTDVTVKLKDGRTMPVKVAVQAARPALKLLSMKVEAVPLAGVLPVTLSGKDEILLDGKVTFVVQTKDAFPRTETIEVATDGETAKTVLSLKDGSLILQDEHTALATLDPLKAFGPSTFGKLAMRPVAADGTAGEWVGLGVLVRAPAITAVKCTTADAPTCSVEGKDLFFAQAFGAGKDFAKSAEVPSGFADASFNVPTPADGTTLYMKLRDDPAEVAMVTLATPVAKTTPAAASAPAAAPAPANPSAPAAASAGSSAPAKAPATP